MVKVDDNERPAHVLYGAGTTLAITNLIMSVARSRDVHNRAERPS